MLQSGTSRVILAAAKSVAQKRSASAVATPPTVHVSNAEKYILGGIMCSSFLIIPGWVLANVKHYRGN